MFLTGSYDHKVNLYDIRCNDVVLTADHGHPVESVVMFPGGGLVISAGKPLFQAAEIYVNDVLSESKRTSIACDIGIICTHISEAVRDYG